MSTTGSRRKKGQRSRPVDAQCGAGNLAGVRRRDRLRHTELAAAHGRQNADFRAVAYGRAQSGPITNALAVDENVDVRTDLAELGDQTIADSRRIFPEQRKRLGHRSRLTINANRPAISGELAQGPGNDEDKRHQILAALTETIGGRPSRTDDQLFPSFAEPKSFPLRVPKHTPAGSSESTVI